MKHLVFVIMMSLALCVGAQNADKLYEQGKKLYDAKQYTQAIAKLKPAAEKGHKKAQYRLGRCYDKGNGVPENDKKAFYWYSKAAAQGHAKAQYQVGKSYKSGKGAEKNITKAVEYFTKAAKQDNADAQFALGKCFLKGKGVPADKSRAKALIKKAVKNDKEGKEILKKLRKDASAGDEDAKAILALIK